MGKVAHVIIRTPLQWVKKHKLCLGMIVVPLIVWHVPSIDHLEETHGFLFADGILRGNGVLVGTKVDGVDHVAFLTCKHVVTTPYRPANVAYVREARDGYGLYLNSPGKGFRYVRLTNINPRRWQLAKDADVDLAWIVLSDDEVRMISGRNGPAYIQLQRDFISKGEDMLCMHDFMSEGIVDGTTVKTTRVCSIVIGNQLDPVSCLYYSAVMNVPFIKSALALACQRRGTLLRIGHDVNIHDYCAGNVRRRVSTFDVGSSIGCSGSPVFAQDKNGRRKLIGLVIAANNDISHFQSLDFALTELRESLSQSR